MKRDRLWLGYMAGAAAVFIAQSVLIYGFHEKIEFPGGIGVFTVGLFFYLFTRRPNDS